LSFISFVFYTIDTLSDKKVIINHVNGKQAIKASFDSISYSATFIVGYKNNEISIYNHLFKELPLSNIRKVYLDKYFPKAQILQKNKIREINLKGKDYKLGDGPAGVVLYGPREYYVSFKIYKDINGFNLLSE